MSEPSESHPQLPPLPSNHRFTFESPMRWGTSQHGPFQPPTQPVSTFANSESTFSSSSPSGQPASSPTPHPTSRSSSPVHETSRFNTPLRSTQQQQQQHPRDQGINNVLAPIFVDQLAKLFGLTGANNEILRSFVEVGSVTPPLSQPDLATRSYILAAILSRPGVTPTAGGFNPALRPVTIDEVTAIMADLKIQLEDSFHLFHLTKEQTENARAIAQDLIYEAVRTNFKLLWTDVQQRLARDQNVLRMNNIFGSPHREKVLVSLIKRQSSSVRNAFRQDIRDSISGGKGRRSLVDFTWQTAVKYRRAGAADLDVSFTIKNALLRRFALQNPELLNIAENEHHSEGDPELTHVDPDDGPAHKKRKKNSRGRVADGECFWSKFEEYVGPLIQEMGSDMTTSAWKKYSEELIAHDRRNFPHPGDQIETVPITEPFIAGASTFLQPLPTFAPPAPSSASALQPGRTGSYNLSSLLN